MGALAIQRTVGFDSDACSAYLVLSSSPGCPYLHVHACGFATYHNFILYKLLLQLTGSKPLHLAALKDNMDVMRILITECGCKADLGDEVVMIT